MLRNKYYWNNYTTKKDSSDNVTEDQKLIGLYQRFPLGDIMKEKQEFNDDIQKRFGHQGLNDMIGSHIEGFKLKE